MTDEEKRKIESASRLERYHKAKRQDTQPSEYETAVWWPQMMKVMTTPIKPYKGPTRTV